MKTNRSSISALKDLPEKNKYNPEVKRVIVHMVKELERIRDEIGEANRKANIDIDLLNHNDQLHTKCVEMPIRDINNTVADLSGR